MRGLRQMIQVWVGPHLQTQGLNIMTTLKVFFLFLATVAPSAALAPSSPLDSKSVHVGQNVTLKCFYQGNNGLIFYWYKKTVGRKAQLMAEFYKHKQNCSLPRDLITRDPRFKLECSSSEFHLKILDVQMSDSATYYCVSLFSHAFEFLEGITVHVEGSGLKTEGVVNLSKSENVRLFGSATIRCTLRNGTYDGEHGLYWFKGSEDSFLKLIYTHKNSDNVSDKKANTKAHSCVYDLPLNGLDKSEAVDYYCAVVSCGQILLGNTTNLDSTYDSVTIFLSAACAFTSVCLSLLLALSVCKIIKKTKSIFSEPQPKRLPAHVKIREKSYRTAVSVATNRSMRQKDGVWSECVYYRY
uniref:Ig-like domain-containing protein n=1 Tax=Poecilia reticulata TaxID=8081 RepID=A0A3P9NFW5_POERE